MSTTNPDPWADRNPDAWPPAENIRQLAKAYEDSSPLSPRLGPTQGEEGGHMDVLTAVAPQIEKLEQKITQSGALGIALDCLADLATVAQLRDAQTAARDLSEEAAAQLGYLIDARRAEVAAPLKKPQVMEDR